MTKIFYACVERELSGYSFDRHLNALPVYIRDTIIRYHRWQDRHLVLYGKLLLREGLRFFGRHDLNLNDIRYSKFKRPYFENGIDFNISHSGNCAVCVISDNARVGIDIEDIKPIDIIDFKNQWTETEWKHILQSENKYNEFFRFWTRKEAVLKADGQGLYIPLAEIEVINELVQVGNNIWFLQEVEICQNSIAHLATNMFMETMIPDRLIFDTE